MQIAPIYANEILVGSLMFGQILNPANRNVYDRASDVSTQYGLNLSHDMIRQMPMADADYIHSAVNMMTMCANYLCAQQIIRGNPNVLIYHLQQYIKTHLDADLSVDELCKRFYVSRAKLYQISKQAFHMGISDYVRMLRIQKAKKLIENTDASISQIAASVGFTDANYFIRIFKQSEGTTPLQYRKK